jgi:hypothetical protein
MTVEGDSNQHLVFRLQLHSHRCQRCGGPQWMAADHRLLASRFASLNVEIVTPARQLVQRWKQEPLLAIQL